MAEAEPEVETVDFQIVEAEAVNSSKVETEAAKALPLPESRHHLAEPFQNLNSGARPRYRGSSLI